MGVGFPIFMKCVTFIKKVCHFVRRRCCDEWTKLVLFILRISENKQDLVKKHLHKLLIFRPEPTALMKQAKED